MPPQAALRGLKAMTGRALQWPGPLVIFALVFRLTASAVEVVVEHWGAGLLPSRHDTAGVDALLAARTLEPHAA
jgi:hypothetical protein